MDIEKINSDVGVLKSPNTKEPSGVDNAKFNIVKSFRLILIYVLDGFFQAFRTMLDYRRWIHPVKNILIKHLIISVGTFAVLFALIYMIVPRKVFEMNMKRIDWKSYESHNFQQLISEFPGPINWRFHDLCGWSLSERGPVLKELSERYPRESIPYMIKFLDSGNAPTRAYAIQFLAAFPSEDVLPKLIIMLDDTDGQVAFFAFEAIKVYYFGDATFCYRTQDNPEIRKHFKEQAGALSAKYRGIDRKGILKDLIEGDEYPRYYAHPLEVFAQSEAVMYLLNLALSSRTDKGSIYFKIETIGGNDLCAQSMYSAEMDSYVSAYVRRVVEYNAAEFSVWLALGRLQHVPLEGFAATKCQSEAEAIRVISADIEMTIRIWRRLYNYFDGLKGITTPPKYDGASECRKCIQALEKIESPKIKDVIIEVEKKTKR
jgi:hypothetical protein